MVSPLWFVVWGEGGRTERSGGIPNVKELLFADPTVVLLLLFNTSTRCSVPNVHLPYAPARSTLVMRVGAVLVGVVIYTHTLRQAAPDHRCVRAAPAHPTPDGVAQLRGRASWGGILRRPGRRCLLLVRACPKSTHLGKESRTAG